jgi:hypothetical protein
MIAAVEEIAGKMPAPHGRKRNCYGNKLQQRGTH